ncbi:MAG: DUF1275 domain-containing protein [Opitutaceae bacterium]|nr:DUF1275 domain-containing protein [Opitutaceae bacterium]
MIAKLPRWVWIGAALLAGIAGTINAVGFLSVAHQGVTHLTGTSTLFGLALGEARWREAGYFLALIAAFVAGAMFSGLLIRERSLVLGRRYGLALIVEALLLCAAVPLLRGQSVWGDYLASAACGLQNAMVSTYSGAALRTTHVSGMFTDIGIALGAMLRGLPADRLKFKLWTILIGAFAGGGAAGAILFGRFGFGTLYVPAAITAVTGTAYWLYCRYRHVAMDAIARGE